MDLSSEQTHLDVHFDGNNCSNDVMAYSVMTKLSRLVIFHRFFCIKMCTLCTKVICKDRFKGLLGVIIERSGLLTK